MSDRPALTFDVPEGTPITECRSCGESIQWIRTKRGKNMPVDYPEGTSHFATCPDAQRWRKR